MSLSGAVTTRGPAGGSPQQRRHQLDPQSQQETAPGSRAVTRWHSLYTKPRLTRPETEGSSENGRNELTSPSPRGSRMAGIGWRRHQRGFKDKTLSRAQPYLDRGSQEASGLEGGGFASSMPMDSTGQSLEMSWPDPDSCWPPALFTLCLLSS